MADLDFNIEMLEFPINTDPEKKPVSEKPTPPNTKPMRYIPNSSITIPPQHTPFNYKLFLILNDYLQPSSLTTHFKAMANIRSIYPDGNESINEVCFELAEQIPYSHPSHYKLAHLYWALSQSDEKNGEKEEKSPRQAFYTHLSRDLLENDIHPGYHLDDINLEASDPMRYVNYQAFLAHLASLHLHFPSPDDVVYAMRGVFEGWGEKEKHPAIQEAYVMGAAQWILWYGVELFKMLLLRWDEDPERKGVFKRRHWGEWRLEFRKIARDGGVGEECRGVAGKAADMMDVIERSLVF